TRIVLEQQLASLPAAQEPFQPLHVALAEVLAAFGDRAGATAALARAGVPTYAPRRLAWRRAVPVRVLLLLGDHARALDELDDRLTATDGWTIENLMGDPRLDPVRNDPRFAALVAKHSRR